MALSYPPRVRVRATVKLSAAFFSDESSITIGGGGRYESAIAPEIPYPQLNYYQPTCCVRLFCFPGMMECNVGSPMISEQQIGKTALNAEFLTVANTNTPID